jgi:DNA polymerase III delta subunit
MIYTIVGDNTFERRHAIKARVQAFVAEYGDFALERLQGDEATFEQLQAAVTSMSFLAVRKLVVIQKYSANKEFTEALPTLISQIPETTDILLDESKLDKRTTFYKWAKSHTTFEDFVPLDDQRLATWLVAYAKEQHATFARADAAFIIQRIGNDQQRLAHEIDKLALLGGTITRERIIDMTEQTPQSKVFDLLDAAFSGDSTRALVLYDDQRAQRVEPQEILAMIGWQLRQIAFVKTAGSHDIVREAKMSPYGATKAGRIANSMSMPHLKQLVHELATLDARSKRSSIDLGLALQSYIIHISP